MKEVIINSIFKEADCRVTYDLLALTKNGEFYEIQKGKAANGKLSEAIVIKDNVSENIAKSEFLRNYLRSGSLRAKTKKSILAYIKKLEDSNTEDLEYKESNTIENGVQTGIEEIINENSNIYFDKEKFIYNTTAHDIQTMVSLIIESRINNVSPYKLSQKYEVGAGTIYTWYKDINELRILYTFYNLEYNEIRSILSNYSKDNIIDFEEKLINDVQGDKRLDENIKKIYIDLISEKRYEKKESTISDVDRYMKKIILEKVLNGSSGLSQEFISKKKQEILEFILNDERILNIIIDNIELEI